MRLACIALALTIAAGASPPEKSQPSEAASVRIKMGAVQMVLGGLVQFYTEWPSGRAPCNEQKLVDVSTVAILTLRADYSKDADTARITTQYSCGISPMPLSKPPISIAGMDARSRPETFTRRS
jgi:hypothetical protein